MESDRILGLTTITVALISLIGTFLQYIFRPRKPRSDEEFGMSQALEKITIAYDNLFEQLNERLNALDLENKNNRILIEELSKLKEELEIKIEEQDKEIKRLEELVKNLEREREQRVAQLAENI